MVMRSMAGRASSRMYAVSAKEGVERILRVMFFRSSADLLKIVIDFTIGILFCCRAKLI